MRIALLGPLELRDADGRPIEVGGARLRALLARLALEPGRVVSTERLVDAVWDDDPPDGSANALQSLVSRLRRVVGRDAIEGSPAGYRLVASAECVDVARFQALVARGELAEAENLWRGPLLADLGDARFAADFAVRLNEQRLSATEERLSKRLDQGREVLSELEPLAARHPLRERLQGLLIRALYSAGRQAEALEAYEKVRHDLAEKLGADPSPELAELHVAILRHQPARTRSNLRAQLTSFVGREADVERLERAIGHGRLVTVVGSGGAGKTRLAVETAARVRDRGESDGVWLVELASVTDPHAVASAIVTAIGARESALFESGQRPAPPREGADRLVDLLGRQRALLVLDNCEHLVDAVAELTERLLGACPDLHVLATSRESLGVPGEALYPIPPLEWPPEQGVDGAGDYPAVRLFVERAKAVRPDFTADTDSSMAAVVEICRRLDGQPLAIELAAARVRALPVAQIAARLDDRFRLLTSGSRTALPRHRTLEAVVAWSWDLLSDDERRLAELLAVFPAGATLDALEEVSDTEVLPVLTSLVDKSLVERLGEHYRMLETVRAYGMERLAEAGRANEVREAHAHYFAGLLGRADPELRTGEQLVWLERLRADHDNVLATLAFACEIGDADLAVSLVARSWWYWVLQGSRSEALTWVRAVLDVEGGTPSAERAIVLVFNGLTAAALGEPDRAKRSLAEAIDLCRRPGILEQVPALRVLRAIGPSFVNDWGRSLEDLETELPLLTGWERSLGLLLAAHLLENIGDMPTAERFLAESRTGFEALGDRWGISSCLRVGAEHLARAGDLRAAITNNRRALALIDELRAPEDRAPILGQLATAHARLGETEIAAAYLREAWDHVERDGQPELSAYIRVQRAEVAMHRGDFDAAVRDLELAESEAANVQGPPHVKAIVATYRAIPAIVAGDVATARERLRTAVEIGIGVRDMPNLASAVQILAAVELLESDPERCAFLLGVATALRGVEDASGFDETVRPAARARELVGTAAFEAARARGAALSPDAALDALTSGSGSRAGPAGRTPRAARARRPASTAAGSRPARRA